MGRKERGSKSRAGSGFRSGQGAGSEFRSGSNGSRSTPRSKTGSKAKRTDRRPQKKSSPKEILQREMLLIEMDGFADYALLDSGAGRKLERFGSVVVDRPEPQALWKPSLKKTDWAAAHGVFSASSGDEEKGKWRLDKPVPSQWPVKIGDVTVLCKMQGLWHLGLFPEQKPHWDFMLERIAEIKGRRARVLNLFAYTGAGSLIAAKAGAHVTHVDASKKSVLWAKENQAASNLSEAPIRWIIDDAAKFVSREVRRGNSYDVILVDPPKFGRGPAGETWELFSSLPSLLVDCSKLVEGQRGSMVLTVYAIRASALAFEQLCRQVFGDDSGQFTGGELVISPQGGGPSVPTSLFVRWRGQGYGA